MQKWPTMTDPAKYKVLADSLSEKVSRFEDENDKMKYLRPVAHMRFNKPGFNELVTLKFYKHTSWVLAASRPYKSVDWPHPARPIEKHPKFKKIAKCAAKGFHPPSWAVWGKFGSEFKF